MRSQLADRLLEIDLAVLKLDAGLLLEKLGDVTAGDGAEKLALLADADLDADGLAVDLREEVRARLVVEAVLAAGFFAGFRLGDVDVVVRRRSGELARKEEVAGKAVGDVLDVTGAGGAFDLL